MTESVTDLLVKCAEARHSGKDFSAVWNEILKGHRLVIGDPIQRADGAEPYLAIPLLSGRHLVFSSVGFSLR